MHCLTERLLLETCESVGISFGHQIVAGTIHTADRTPHDILPRDVVSWAHCSYVTFSTMRTEFKRARQAHSLLLQNEATLNASHRFLLDMLEIMLGDTILPPPALGGRSAGQSHTEYTVLTIGAAPFNARVQAAIDVLSI